MSAKIRRNGERGKVFSAIKSSVSNEMLMPSSWAANLVCRASMTAFWSPSMCYLSAKSQVLLSAIQLWPGFGVLSSLSHA